MFCGSFARRSLWFITDRNFFIFVFKCNLLIFTNNSLVEFVEWSVWHYNRIYLITLNVPIDKFYCVFETCFNITQKVHNASAKRIFFFWMWWTVYNSFLFQCYLNMMLTFLRKVSNLDTSQFYAATNGK